LFHTDASQAFQFLDCNANAFGVDLMTISGHKIYGPKGIGALYVREELLRKNFLVPFVVGGGQEFGLRAGTENVPLIVGFQKAVELTLKFREKEGRRIQALKERFVRGVRAMVSGAEVNGPAVRDGIPHIVNLYFPGRASEEMFVKLDLSGIAISAGSACTARAALPSYVLQAMGYSRTRAASSIRVSFGRPTTRKEIDTALKVIKMVMKK
jgi:cysteine desulfurase